MDVHATVVKALETFGAQQQLRELWVPSIWQI